VNLAKSRKPTPAQRAVLEAIRGRTIYYSYPSPRRSGIPAATFKVIREAAWIDFGEELPAVDKLLILSETGPAILDLGGDGR
jgi:hypothetical protein